MKVTEGWNLKPYLEALAKVDPLQWSGKVTNIVGLLVESQGPATAIGDFCEVQTGIGRNIRMQVIGFREGARSLHAAGGNRWTAGG